MPAASKINPTEFSIGLKIVMMKMMGDKIGKSQPPGGFNPGGTKERAEDIPRVFVRNVHSLGTVCVFG